AMGNLTEDANVADKAFTREEQDAFSARSHQLAARAWEEGRFEEEVVTVQVPQRKGDPVDFRTDEGIRAATTTESLGTLRPAFSKDGTITAGSASQISDGAAAVVVMSKARAQQLGLSWIAEIGAHGVVAGPDS
ncbi:acetyl-CoA C-acyltransferase, partial [Acinetobacter baumannii]|nr:acetyl-CoA C-acyltransferase [Acinetobacter baumannii]